MFVGLIFMNLMNKNSVDVNVYLGCYFIIFYKFEMIYILLFIIDIF